MEAVGSAEQPDIRTYLRILNRRKLTVAITVLLFVAVAVGYSVVTKPTYTASAQVLVPEQSATSALQPVSNSQLPAAESLQRTLLDAQQFAEGDATKRDAQAALDHPAKVSVSASTTSDILTFKASSGNRDGAAAIANAFANAYIKANSENQVAQYTQQVTALQGSITKLQAGLAALSPGDQQVAADQASIASLTQSLQQLQAASQVAAQTGPSVVQAAVSPSAPSSPKPLRNGLIGLVAGLIVGLALAFLRDRLDDKIKSVDDLRAVTDDAPVVGLVPMVSGWRQTHSPHLAMVEDSTSAISEAYRTLRTAIQFLGIDEPQRVIGLTSATSGEGKSTMVANLGLSFARAGRRVIVVSADLRRPRLHAFFGMDNRTGLTSVLLGEASVREAVREVDGEPNLRVLPSGPVPPNPAEILSLDRVRELVDVLAGSADVVLVDCPPTLPVSDSLLISRVTDGILVVTAAARAKRQDLHRCFELLRQVNAPIMGTIVNAVPQGGAAGYSYGYGYGYGYGYEPDGGASPAVRDESTSATPQNGQVPAATESWAVQAADARRTHPQE